MVLAASASPLANYFEIETTGKETRSTGQQYRPGVVSGAIKRGVNGSNHIRPEGVGLAVIHGHDRDVVDDFVVRKFRHMVSSLICKACDSWSILDSRNPSTIFTQSVYIS